jgi:hypothetical protein
MEGIMEVVNVGGMILKPTSYSKSQTVEAIVEKISKYPAQRTNTTEAIKGLSVEFICFDGPPDQPVGTLSEFYTENPVNHFFIKTHKGGIVAIERQPSGDFIVVEAIPEKRNN